MTQPTVVVRGVSVSLPARFSGLAAGTVLPATVLALPGRQQYLLAMAGRQVPWHTAAPVAAGERVAVLVTGTAARAAAAPAAPAAAATDGAPPAVVPGAAPSATSSSVTPTVAARVFTADGGAELLRRLQLPVTAEYRTALQTLLQGERPFVAAQVRQLAAGTADPAGAAPASMPGSTPPRPAAVSELLNKLNLPDDPAHRAAVTDIIAHGQSLTVERVRQLLPPAMPAATTATAGAAVPAHWGVTDTPAHRLLAAMLLAAGRTFAPETARELAARADQWGATDGPGLRALVRQWERGFPATRKMWEQLRAVQQAAGRPPAALAAAAARIGWSAPPEEFSPAYWARLGLTNEQQLEQATVVAGGDLRSSMLQSTDIVPEAAVAAEWLEGMVADAAGATGETATVLPLLFTGAAGPMAGTLTVHDRARGGRGRRASRPCLTLDLTLSVLGPLSIAVQPGAVGVAAFTVGSADAAVAARLQAAGEPLQQALAALGEYVVRFATLTALPEAEAAGAPETGVDVQA